ncbi:MAG: aquaporin [Anaerolineales bacterium]|nr:aquaporin [Anaerolineales bacterium]
MSKEEQRQVAAEGLGTFMLVLVGAGAVALNPGNLVVAALAHGLILVAIIATYGHISGAHVNPAVTFGLFLGGKIEFRRAGFYWIAQFIGALVAGVILRIILPDPSTMGQTVPAANINSLDVVLVEGILTFFLVSVVYQAAAYGKGGILTPVLIGLTLAGCILLGGPMTGASLNPARTLGPALLAENGQNLMEVGTYWFGIFLGAAFAGFIQTDMFAPEEHAPVKRGSKKK